MLTGPFGLSQTRELLATLDHRPVHKLGQNFLVDGNIVRKSLELAEVKPGDIVVEVGPGLGTLTTTLLGAGATVYAVEADPRLAQHLRDRVAPDHPGRFHLLEGDAMDHPLAGYPQSADAGKPFKIVANLPYAISTPWMAEVIMGEHHPEVLVLMLQREAADRLTAPVGTKHYAGITIALGAAFERKPGHAVPAKCFFPPPDVESYLLHLRRRPDGRRLKPATRLILRTVFMHRRKQLGAALKFLDERPVALDAWLADLPKRGHAATDRPEVIPPELWLDLDSRL